MYGDYIKFWMYLKVQYSIHIEIKNTKKFNQEGR